MRYVIGDIHGAGEELKGLLDQISPTSSDEIILVGDVFDRGIHAHIVWDLILQHRMEVFMGNHEYKMLHWMQGRRDWLPQHYYTALNILLSHGVAPNALLEWLDKRPLLRLYDNFIVTHAAVDPVNPLSQNVSWNVFGNMPEPMPRPKKGDKGVYFWDSYQGDQVVVYGHLVTDDNLPRIRTNPRGEINSVGLDTAAVHGGNLTAVCLETLQFYSYRSGKDWGSLVRQQNKIEPPVVNPDLMKFVLLQRQSLKESLLSTSHGL